MQHSKLLELKSLLIEAGDLSAVAALLHWDQATYLPPGGAVARGRQVGALSRLAHEKFTDARIGELLDELRPLGDELDYDSDEAGLLRATRRAYERAVKVPGEFEARLSDHLALSYQAWSEARPANDFGRVLRHLEKTLDLSRELASFFPGHEHIADPLIEYSDEGLTARRVRELFSQLRAQLVPLVEAAAAQPVDDGCLRGHFDPAAQLAFAAEIATAFGYDWRRGRLDISPHPFMTKFSLDDVRITTRVQTGDMTDALFSTLHETGHALYEQGISRAYESTPLGVGTSSGVHESQSRLWENLVGRSRAFWEHWYPRLQATFPSFESVPPEEFYRAINKVERSLIRTEADELTYNLHVMLRFDLELALLEGTLAVRDLPEAWRERYRTDLGVAPADDRDGVLQDVHWFSGVIGGAFQGYTLGNILAAQFFAAAQRAEPELATQIARAEYAPLRAWLTENIYRHGSKYTAPELIERATGEPLSIAPYMEYLKAKFDAQM
jgi:carboxypeptidase Taq